jgi:hypothetical protein
VNCCPRGRSSADKHALERDSPTERSMCLESWSAFLRELVDLLISGGTCRGQRITTRRCTSSPMGRVAFPEAACEVSLDAGRVGAGRFFEGCKTLLPESRCCGSAFPVLACPQQEVCSGVIGSWNGPVKVNVVYVQVDGDRDDTECAGSRKGGRKAGTNWVWSSRLLHTLFRIIETQRGSEKERTSEDKTLGPSSVAGMVH